MLTPNYTYDFERWLGRKLTDLERRVIYPIERHRQSGEPTRIYVHDPDLLPWRMYTPTRQILLDYFTWVTERMTPRFNALLMCRTKKESIFSAYRLAHHKPRRDTVLASSICPDRLRGRTFDVALLLDTQRYPYRKRHDGLQRYKNVICGGTSLSRHSLVIIHGSYNAKGHFGIMYRNTVNYPGRDMFKPVSCENAVEITPRQLAPPLKRIIWFPKIRPRPKPTDTDESMTSLSSSSQSFVLPFYPTLERSLKIPA